MFAPPEAHRAEVEGYLSEGIRIRFQFPKEGESWLIDTVTEYGPYFMKGRLEANKGFALTDSSLISFSGRTAKVYSIVGQNENIPEPEKSTFIILAGKKYHFMIELVSPTSKLKDYENIYQALLETFTMAPDQALKK